MTLVCRAEPWEASPFGYPAPWGGELHSFGFVSNFGFWVSTFVCSWRALRLRASNRFYAMIHALCFGPPSAVPGRSYALLLALCPDQDTVRANVRTETAFAPARIRVRLHSLTVAPEV